MKLAAKDAPKAFAGLKDSQKVVLAYGEDAGGVSDLLSQAEKAICGSEASPQDARQLIGPSEIGGDAARLADEAAQPGFFGDLKILRVGPVTESHLPALKAVTEGPRSAYILIDAGALAPRNKVRQYFEKSKDAYIIPVYRDEARDVDRLIDGVLTSQGFKVAPDARQYLQSVLGADRAISRSELEKLKLFASSDPDTPIDFDMARNLIGDSSDRSAGDIAAATYSGQGVQAEVLLAKAFSQGTNGIEVVRAMARRCTRLATACALMKDGESLEGAMKGLRPPVFWKEKAAYQAQIQHWSLTGLERTMSLLNEAEKSLKSSGPPEEAVLGRTILSIAGQWRRAKR